MQNLNITPEISEKLNFMKSYSEKNSKHGVGFKTLDDCVEQSNKHSECRDYMREVIKKNTEYTDNYDIDYVIYCMIEKINN